MSLLLNLLSKSIISLSHNTVIQFNFYAVSAVKMYEKHFGRSLVISWIEIIYRQSILADHLPLALEKLKYHKLHQGSAGNIFRDEKENLSRWREYFEGKHSVTHEMQ